MQYNAIGLSAGKSSFRSAKVYFPAGSLAFGLATSSWLKNVKHLLEISLIEGKIKF